MNTHKFIAFIDVLGFKDLVENNSHDNLVNFYERLFSSSVAVGLAKGQREFYTRDGKEYWQPKYSEISVNSLIVSDSIIIWTNDTNMKSFIDLIVTVKITMSHSFNIGFPLRGAIVEGNLSSFKNVYNSKSDNSTNTLVGLGLVKAYKLEEEQDWSGCVIEDTCIETFEKLIISHKEKTPDVATVNDLINTGLIAKYKVPFKSGPLKEKYVINWITKKKDDVLLSEASMRKKFADYNKQVGDWKVEKIIKNTLDFVDHIKVTMK